MHDQLWNLIPTTKSINSKKNNYLVNFDRYFKPFAEIQYKALNYAIDQGINKKLLEDYLVINQDMSLNKRIDRSSFKKALRNTLFPLYQIAKNSGFDTKEIK